MTPRPISVDQETLIDIKGVLRILWMRYYQNSEQTRKFLEIFCLTIFARFFSFSLDKKKILWEQQQEWMKELWNSQAQQSEQKGVEISKVFVVEGGVGDGRTRSEELDPRWPISEKYTKEYSVHNPQLSTILFVCTLWTRFEKWKSRLEQFRNSTFVWALYNKKQLRRMKME